MGELLWVKLVVTDVIFLSRASTTAQSCSRSIRLVIGQPLAVGRQEYW